METQQAVVSTTRKKRAAGGGLLYSQKVAPYVFVLPFILSFLIFFAYPVVSTVIMSFQEVLPDQTRFIGFANYKKLLNPDFYKALLNNTKYTFWTLLILIPVPLVLAVLLNSKIMKARNFFRASLFIPALTSVVVAGTIFRLIFGELDGSLLNSFMHMIGLESQKWLRSSGTAMFAMVLLATWRWTGINILYFLSALQSIPNELYESAEMDGASVWQKFRSITLPLLKPVTIYVLTISIYGGYSMFVESYTMFNGNNSPNQIGLTMIGYIYKQGLESNNLGFGSAIGLTLLVITLLVNLVQLKSFGLFKKEE
ncbi:carbohydrate ABC transporter permease [Paenibacillus sedimenti]|uniref:Sugar ABC transporter permease n=1 Tax=Paenibacillus sedimenti TaxID=2770274 RepID=A0A926KXB5_9BACL|nr:sugar ABC transporter permease [Paenibacillus sedimenti]MBD0383675.1 sugar ABC transporter permease [Paenibacillus sedimenti]